MRTGVGLALLVAGVLVAVSVISIAARADDGAIWSATLRGGNEVPALDTPARGHATFQSNDDGSIDYGIVVSQISNAFAAHIHCGAESVNGPVGVTLFMGTAGSGPTQGLLVRSTFTAPDAGNGCGWVTNADVAAAVAAGGAYVNVHTNDGVDPGNTGSGDFPGGEIRGQVVVLHDG